MNSRLIYFLFFLMSKISFAQTEAYCKTLNEEFYSAVKSGVVSEIDFRYYKLLNTCGASFGNIGALDGSFENKGFTISWRQDQSYEITNVPTHINQNEYFAAYYFDELPVENPIKQKYESLDAFLKAVPVDVENLVMEPVLLPKYQIIWIKQYGSDQILDDKTFEEIIRLNEPQRELSYAGVGVFYINMQEKTEVYAATVKKNRPVFSKIIDAPGNTTIFPVSNDKDYIIIDNFLSEENMSVYDHTGKMLLKKHEYIEINPLSKTFTLVKNGLYTLVDLDLKPILKNAVYIVEIMKNDQSYYVFDSGKGNKSVYDKTGKFVVSGKEYTDLEVSQYVLVQKNNQYGVINFPEQTILVPFIDEKITELCLGFMTYFKIGAWQIIDEKNRTLGTIKATKIDLLTSRGKALIKALNEAGKVGVCDLFGNEILPVKYDSITFETEEIRLLVKSDQREFYTNLDGQEIE